MKKQQFSLSAIVFTIIAANVLVLGLAIFTLANIGIYNQSHLHGVLNAKTHINNENADVTNNEKALQLNGLNNDINQFMIYEFKNIYRVNA